MILSKRVDVLPKQRGREAQNIRVAISVHQQNRRVNAASLLERSPGDLRHSATGRSTTQVRLEPQQWTREVRGNVVTLTQQCVSYEGRTAGSGLLEANELCGLPPRDLIWGFPTINDGTCGGTNAA